MQSTTQEQQKMLDDAYHERLMKTEKKELEELKIQQKPEQVQNNYSDGLYWYEMCKRPVSIGCQPKGFVEFDDEKGKHGIIAYDKVLTDKELNVFEMKKWNMEQHKELAKDYSRKNQMEI